MWRIRRVCWVIKNKIQKIFRGYSDVETYALSDTIIRHLQPRLIKFFNESDEIIDWSDKNHVYTFKRKKYNMRELLMMLLLLIEDYMFYTREEIEDVRLIQTECDIYTILGLIGPRLYW